MSLFDKIFGSHPSGPPPDSDVPDWINNADADLQDCDRRTPAGAQGISKKRVDEIVIPMLRGKEIQLAQRYGTMLISPIKLAHGLPQGEAGIRWCTRCQHATVFLSFAREGQVEECSECHTSGPVHYLVYAPHVGQRIRELFLNQVRVLRLVERAATLLGEAKHEDAISELTEALTLSEKVGNRTSVADVSCALGKAYSRAGNWRSALKSLHEAGDWFLEARDFTGLVKAEHGIGEAAFDAGLHSLAETHLLHALDATYQGDETPHEIVERASILNGLAMATITHWDAGRTAIAYSEQADLADLEVSRILIERGLKAPGGEPDSDSFLRVFISQFPNNPDEELKRAVEADSRGESAVAAEHVRAVRKALEATGDAASLLHILNQQLMFLVKDGALVEAARGCNQAEALARRLGRDDALSAALQNGGGLVAVLAQMKVEGYEGRELEGARKKEEGEALGRRVAQRQQDEAGLRAEAGQKLSTDVAGAVKVLVLLAESLQSRGATREQADVMMTIASLQQQLGDVSRSLKSAVDAEALGRGAPSKWIIATSLLVQSTALDLLGSSGGLPFGWSAPPPFWPAS